MTEPFAFTSPKQRPSATSAFFSTALHLIFVALLVFAHQAATSSTKASPPSEERKRHELIWLADIPRMTPLILQETPLSSPAFPSDNPWTQQQESPPALRGEIKTGMLDRAVDGLQLRTVSAAGNIVAGVIPVARQRASSPYGKPSGTGPGPNDGKGNGLGTSNGMGAPAHLISEPVPVYSAEARALNISGVVILKVLLKATGEVRVLQVVRGLGHGLDQAAIAAVEQVRCEPARVGNRIVDVQGNIEVSFKLA